MTTSRELRVVVADDFPAIRRGVVSMVAGASGFRVVGEAGSVDEAIEVVRRESPDLATVDLGMPGARGVELVRTLRQEHPKLGILVFSQHREQDVGLACLKAGANGFLAKDAPLEELLKALRTVADGKRYVSAFLLETLVDSASLPSDEPPHVALSRRELEVLYRVAAGERLVDIAEALGIQTKTVHTYRKRILEKLGVRTTVDLMLYAVEHRLLGWPRAGTRPLSTSDES